jgi:hypothetical protein
MLNDLFKFIGTVWSVFLDGVVLFRLNLRSGPALAAENLFLRKQLALYVERRRKPRRATDSIRFTLARLSRFFEWREALVLVKRDTLIRWHRRGFRLFWKWKSRSPGRPRLPVNVRKLIVEMAISWGSVLSRTSILGTEVIGPMIILRMTSATTAIDVGCW